MGGSLINPSAEAGIVAIDAPILLKSEHAAEDARIHVRDESGPVCGRVRHSSSG